MSNQLLPCPFCGGPAKAAEAYIRGDQAFAHIHCENHCEVAPSAGASSALFYWSDLRKENVRIHSDDKAKLEATELAHAKWNRRATQPAAGEPVETKEIGEMTVTLRDGVKCFSFEEYSEAYKLPEGLHYLYAAPPAAARRDEAVREPELAGYFSFCEDKQKWLQQKSKGAEFNHLFTPLYAMRAQGDGEVQ